MKFKLVCLFLTQAIFSAHAYELRNGQDAYNFCVTNKKSFISIVWPIAQGKDPQIEQLFNKHGKIKYKKPVKLSPSQAYYLLKTAHPHIPNMKEHVNWYFPPGVINHPARVYVLTYDSMETAVACKHAVRRLFSGLQYRSIHINDTHQETIELAQFFFGKKTVRKPGRTFTGFCLLAGIVPENNSLRLYLPMRVDTDKILSV
jgi:hypothetical protein